MIAWLRHHRHSAAQALRRIASAASALSVLVIGVTLALPLGGYTLMANLQSWLPASAYRADVSVFFAAGTASSEIDRVASGLRARAGVKEVRFVPREAALAALKKSTGLSDLIGALPENPLPDALVVVLDSQDGELAQHVASGARSIKSVASAQVDSAWIRRLDAMLSLARSAVLVLAIVLGAGLLAIVFNTIRLQIVTQRDEIEVLRLVGATDSYIRRPFLYFGSLEGALGGLAALAIVAGSLAALQADVSRLSGLYGSGFRLSLPGGANCVALVAVSAFLGWLGAAASVSKYLHNIRHA